MNERLFAYSRERIQPSAMHQSAVRGPVRWKAADAHSDELVAEQHIDRVATVAASSMVETQKRRRMLTFVACNNCRERKKSVSSLPPKR
jgi:hypothetical protein